MSTSSSPKETPVQHSPSDGEGADTDTIQSPLQSTPSTSQKKRISSLLQSPVSTSQAVCVGVLDKDLMCVCVCVCVCVFV